MLNRACFVSQARHVKTIISVSDRNGCRYPSAAFLWYQHFTLQQLVVCSQIPDLQTPLAVRSGSAPCKGWSYKGWSSECDWLPIMYPAAASVRPGFTHPSDCHLAALLALETRRRRPQPLAPIRNHHAQRAGRSKNTLPGDLPM